MLKLQVDRQLLETLLASVIPLVEKYTHWDLHAPMLRWRSIPREQAYEEIFIGRVKGAGIPISDGIPQTMHQRLTKYSIEMSTLAAYEPSNSEILVIRDNVDDGNIDALRLILAHELVHRAQHVRYPQLFERIDEMIRNQWFAALTCHWSNPVREEIALERTMSVLESHAAFIQEKLQHEHFSMARFEMPSDATGMLLRILGSGKTSQYTRALPEIIRAVNAEGMDDLYGEL